MLTCIFQVFDFPRALLTRPSRVHIWITRRRFSALDKLIAPARDVSL
jgi:hypothetical protein